MDSIAQTSIFLLAMEFSAISLGLQLSEVGQKVTPRWSGLVLASC